MRVGSPKLDNYHRVRGAGGGAPQFTSGAQITYEDNANSIKHRLWEETDRAYRAAAERLIRIQTNTQVKVAEAGLLGRFFERADRGLARRAGETQVRRGRSGPAASASSPRGSGITPPCSPAR